MYLALSEAKKTMALATSSGSRGFQKVVPFFPNASSSLIHGVKDSRVLAFFVKKFHSTTGILDPLNPID